MIIFCIVVFLVAMIVVGYVATKKVKNSNDYYLGNKEFGPFATAFKFASTWESGSKLVGSPGQAYASGMTAFLQGLTSPLAYFMSFRVFGPRLKAASDYYDVITVPEMLGKRYHSQTVHTVSSLALLVGLMGTLLGQFQSIGNVVGTVLEIRRRRSHHRFVHRLRRLPGLRVDRYGPGRLHGGRLHPDFHLRRQGGRKLVPPQPE